MLHFHANGEDIGLTQKLMGRIADILKLNIICMEYPGYGIYKNYKMKDNTTLRAQQILSDAESLFKFVTGHLGVKQENILISGRSIGSGPACHLASIFKPACLLLVSPIKSVVDVAR